MWIRRPQRSPIRQTEMDAWRSQSGGGRLGVKSSPSLCPRGAVSSYTSSPPASSAPSPLRLSQHQYHKTLSRYMSLPSSSSSSPRLHRRQVRFVPPGALSAHLAHSLQPVCLARGGGGLESRFIKLLQALVRFLLCFDLFPNLCTGAFQGKQGPQSVWAL